MPAISHALLCFTSQQARAEGNFCAQHCQRHVGCPLVQDVLTSLFAKLLQAAPGYGHGLGAPSGAPQKPAAVGPDYGVARGPSPATKFGAPQGTGSGSNQGDTQPASVSQVCMVGMQVRMMNSRLHSACGLMTSG